MQKLRMFSADDFFKYIQKCTYNILMMILWEIALIDFPTNMKMSTITRTFSRKTYNCLYAQFKNSFRATLHLKPVKRIFDCSCVSEALHFCSKSSN